MDESGVKEGMNEIQYVNGNSPIFQMTSNDIKSGKSCVSKGE